MNFIDDVAIGDGKKFRSQTSDNMERCIREEKESAQRRSRSAKRYKSRDRWCFWRVFGSAGSKSRLAKAMRAEPCGGMRDE